MDIQQSWIFFFLAREGCLEKQSCLLETSKPGVRKGIQQGQRKPGDKGPSSQCLLLPKPHPHYLAQERPPGGGGFCLPPELLTQQPASLDPQGLPALVAAASRPPAGRLLPELPLPKPRSLGGGAAAAGRRQEHHPLPRRRCREGERGEAASLVRGEEVRLRQPPPRGSRVHGQGEKGRKGALPAAAGPAVCGSVGGVRARRTPPPLPLASGHRFPVDLFPLPGSPGSQSLPLLPFTWRLFSPACGRHTQQAQLARPGGAAWLSRLSSQSPPVPSKSIVYPMLRVYPGLTRRYSVFKPNIYLP